MRGVSLLEFLVALCFLLAVLFCGFQAFDLQQQLIGRLHARTAFDRESNYRMLAMKGLVESAAEKLAGDPFLSQAAISFPDLDFGRSPGSTSFSVAVPAEQPRRFQRNDPFYLTDRPLSDPSRLLLFAGVNEEAEFDWNYGRVDAIEGPAGYRISFILDKPALDAGSLVETLMYGFSFENNTVYLVGPGGNNSPFLSRVDSFRSDAEAGLVKIRWRRGSAETQFLVMP